MYVVNESYTSLALSSERTIDAFHMILLVKLVVSSSTYPIDDYYICDI